MFGLGISLAPDFVAGGITLIAADNDGLTFWEFTSLCEVVAAGTKRS